MKKWILALFTIVLLWNVWLTRSILSSDTKSDTGVASGRYTVTGYTSDISKIVNRVSSSLVRVRGSQEGSGIIFASEEGVVYIVTQSDLLDGQGTIAVTFDSGAVLQGALVGIDEATKTAVVSVTTDFDVTIFTKGKVSDLDAGSYVIGIEARNPSTDIMEVSYGVTSSLGNTKLSSYGLYMAQAFDSDCRFSSNALGAAVTDAGGALMGMVVGNTYGKTQCVGIAEVQKVYEELVQEGSVTRGSLSLSCSNVADMRSYQKNERGLTLNLVEGVIVNQVAGNAKDVLEVNDVIVSMEDKPITNLDSLRDLYYELQSSQEVSIGIIRNGENRTVSVILE